MTIGTKHDAGKPRWSLLPEGVVSEVVHVLEFGAARYGADNWKYVADPCPRYYDAAMRHINAWWEGSQVNDPETGKNHLAHAICCLMFLLWMDNDRDTKMNVTSSQGKEFP